LAVIGFPIVLRELGTRHASPRQSNPVESVSPPFVFYSIIRAAESGTIVNGAIPFDAMPTLTAPDISTARQEELTPLYNVVLLDDDDHTYDYVIEMLEKLFLFSRSQAYQHAVEVDTTGRTVLMTCELPEAEFARDQIHAYGPDWRMPRSKGSMSAIIEPATGGRE
jgi:ATP-dependent Clp protease adaptor protein ClpS